jgi:voltage-gated potassium channel
MSNRVERIVVRWQERLTPVRAVATIVLVALTLVLLAGFLARIVEPDTFSSIGLAYWWAVTTVTTVGYGDVVPTSPGGRVVGALLMLVGLSLIPTVTSVVVAALLAQGRRAEQEQIRAMLERFEAHLTRIEQGR